MTWGSWSNGALGTWDSLPLYQSPGDALPRHAANRGDDDDPTQTIRPTSTLHRRVPETGEIQALPNTRLRMRGRIGLAGARIGRHRFRESAQDQPGGSSTANPSDEHGDDSDDSDTSAHAGPHSSEAGAQDPWELRLRNRRVPQKIEEPTLVQFDPARPDRHFVFDIAFAGWHSAALAINTDIVNFSGASQEEQAEVR